MFYIYYNSNECFCQEEIEQKFEKNPRLFEKAGKGIRIP